MRLVRVCSGDVPYLIFLMRSFVMTCTTSGSLLILRPGEKRRSWTHPTRRSLQCPPQSQLQPHILTRALTKEWTHYTLFYVNGQNMHIVSGQWLKYSTDSCQSPESQRSQRSNCYKEPAKVSIQRWLYIHAWHCMYVHVCPGYKQGSQDIYV